jgi:signal transduction histidine kinase
VVSQAKAHVAHLAAARGIDLTGVAVSDDCVVHGDAQRLHRILRQLLSNAIKFTRSPGRIGVEVGRPDADSVEIAVWDTGIGIPPDLQTRIFDSFAQLSTDVMSRPCDGLGLGLALARRLARQMGGDIRVESAAGAGSRFIVTLPLTQAGQLRTV